MTAPFFPLTQAAALNQAGMLPAGGGGGGGNLLGTLGSIGGILGGLGALTSAVMPLVYQPESPESKMARRKWQAAKPQAERLYNMLVYAPWMEGKNFPFSKTAYEFSPTQSTQAMYTNALSRSYGMPSGVAQAFSTQAMSQLRNQGLSSGMTPMQAAASLRLQPEITSQAMLAKQQIGMANQRSLMTNAQRLADYNAWRSAQVRGLIG